MIRRVARFILLEHVTATLWITGIIVLAALLNEFGAIYSLMHSAFGTTKEAYTPFGVFFMPVGLLALLVFFLAWMLNRRRKQDIAAQREERRRLR